MEMFSSLFEVKYHPVNAEKALSSDQVQPFLDHVKVIAYSPTSVDFQLIFTNAYYVSLDSLNLDYITVKINRNLFIDPISGTTITF